jgi:hypothetical protein
MSKNTTTKGIEKKSNKEKTKRELLLEINEKLDKVREQQDAIRWIGSGGSR